MKRMTEQHEGPRRGRHMVAVVKDVANEFGKVDEFEHNENELMNSGVGVNPLHIGYKVEDFVQGGEQGFDFGNGHGGQGDGGQGSGGNGSQGDAGGSEANDEQTGLEWWWLWQWNRANRPLRKGRTTLHFTSNDRNKVTETAILMLVAEVMPPRDMTKATLKTMQVIEDLLPLLFQVLMFPIVYPFVLSEFHENEGLFAATLYGMLGASVVIAAVFSGAVIYGLWRWHNSLWDCDSGEDDTEQD
ncbi:hypothetical protein vseg_008999 [Gypsophila vaccaria]